MKIAKIILSMLTILFAVLGLTKILSFDIAAPIMLTSLATLLLLRGIEYKNSRNKTGFILTCLAAVFVYTVVIYNVFIMGGRSGYDTALTAQPTPQQLYSNNQSIDNK